jgi:hypothetical protein
MAGRDPANGLTRPRVAGSLSKYLLDKRVEPAGSAEASRPLHAGQTGFEPQHALYMHRFQPSKNVGEIRSRSIRPETQYRVGCVRADLPRTCERAQNRLDFRRIVRIAMASAGGLATRRHAKGSPRALRGFGSCERQFWRREPKEPKTMPTLSVESPRTSTAPQPKREASNLRQGGARPPPLRSPPRNRRGPLFRRPGEPPRSCQRRLVKQGSSVSPSRSACSLC